MKSVYRHNQKQVAVLGGANIDITGFPKAGLILSDANPGTLTYCLGGVGRNIAENLARLNVSTKLITVLGDDFNGKNIANHCDAIGIDVSDSLFLQNQPSSVHLAIMNEFNDLTVGISCMDIYEKMGIDFIKTKIETLKKTDLIVIETNIPEKTIEHVLKNAPDQKFCLDSVSGPKAEKVKKHLGRFFMVKTNLIEAEVLTGLKLKIKDDYIKAADYMHNVGVKKVFITLGEHGVFYSDAQTKQLVKPFKTKVINTNGAGDAFFAGVIYSELEGLAIDEAVKFGMSCAALTVSNGDTVNPKMNLKSVYRLINNSDNSSNKTI